MRRLLVFPASVWLAACRSDATTPPESTALPDPEPPPAAEPVEDAPAELESEAACAGEVVVLDHHHFVLEDSGVVAYRKSDLPVTPYLRHGAPYYLAGATSIADHEVDLGPVCVAYKGRVNARLDWVVALADEAEAQAWRARLDSGACGRAPAGCSPDCTRECGGTGSTCCEIYTDSCPGPEGHTSTCATLFPCEERCCAG
jgi:hypothetical protein